MPKTKSNTAMLQNPAPATTTSGFPSSASSPNAKINTATGGTAKSDQNKPAPAAPDRAPGAEDQNVTLKYVAPDAQDVKVAGNFNGWRPDTTPLKKSNTGEWTTQLKLRAGKYEYRFVVDGRWCEDPQAAQRGVNPYGGFNSILNVPSGTRA